MNWEAVTKINLRRTAYIIIAILICLFLMDSYMIGQYRALQSTTSRDRNGAVIGITPNEKNNLAIYDNDLPENVKTLLLQKEDRYFYYHLGLNPVSSFRVLIRSMTGKKTGGASTITQQLSKNLLGNENERNLYNKAIEVAFAFALEIFESKQNILTMYANTVYMGNGIQGLFGASLFYFNKPLNELTDSEIVLLLSSLSNPSEANPAKKSALKKASRIAESLELEIDPNLRNTDPKSSNIHKAETSFELDSLKPECQKQCVFTIDGNLTERLRNILRTNLDNYTDEGATNGAIVVIKLPENELLAIVGSPEPFGQSDGHNFNMAIEPRPIGSTIKPFIYLRAFEKGLRPYSLVYDREYRFPIETGYSLYPKNYDGIYHGIVTLHQALSNSYNVPSVKTLEYIGLGDFYNFLQNNLQFSPLRDLDQYEYGIALGGLEMDPLTLAHYFTIFPNEGILKPLRLLETNDKASANLKTPMSNLLTSKKVTEPKFAQLITKILNDRLTGVEQFGLKSSLNLAEDNYAVKTGTSRDYHDSWTVGYTPDYVVVVWLGNAENKPLKHLSGQSGAGTIWKETMELLMNSEYNKKTPFAFNHIREIQIDDNIDFGLPDDVIDEHQNLLLEDRLIFSPHNGDTINFSNNTVIPLRASKPVSWYINGNLLRFGQTEDFVPQKPGRYKVEARDGNKIEEAKIEVIGLP